MVKSDVGDEHIFSTLLKIHLDTGMVKFLGHRAKPLHFFTVYGYVKSQHVHGISGPGSTPLLSYRAAAPYLLYMASFILVSHVHCPFLAITFTAASASVPRKHLLHIPGPRLLLLFLDNSYYS
jgi:hypothetical protein